MKPEENELVEKADELGIELINGESWHKLAMAYEEEWEWDKAIRCIKKAIEVNDAKNADDLTKLDGAINYHRSLAKLFTRRKRDAEKAEEIAKVRDFMREKEAIIAGSREDWTSLGFEYHLIGDTMEAIRCYERATIAEPGHAHTWYFLGELYRFKGNLEKAEKCLEKAVEITDAFDYRYKWDGAASYLGDLAEIEHALGNADRAEYCREQRHLMRVEEARVRKEDDEERRRDIEMDDREEEMEMQEERRQRFEWLLESGQVSSEEEFNKLDDFVDYRRKRYVKR